MELKSAAKTSRFEKVLTFRNNSAIIWISNKQRNEHEYGGQRKECTVSWSDLERVPRLNQKGWLVRIEDGCIPWTCQEIWFNQRNNKILYGKNWRSKAIWPYYHFSGKRGAVGGRKQKAVVSDRWTHARNRAILFCSATVVFQTN